METNSLFSEQDLKQLEALGVSVEEATQQIESIRKGFPYLNIEASASIERGVVRLDNEEMSYYLNLWEDYLKKAEANVCKMVPASGAASRMFKSLFNFLDSEQTSPEKDESVQRFFDNISRFAFSDRLTQACMRNNWKQAVKLIEEGDYKAVIRNLLTEKGLNYGFLPKGLILFHNYAKGSCTAAEEHLVEGAMYARHSNGKVRIHFTVSPEHRPHFEALIADAKAKYEDRFGVEYEITYSEQKSSTDTIALDKDGEIFRKNDGSMLFRPGGHGSLISNLGDLDADIIFIKNIDNVVPDHLKSSVVIYKKLLGGILVRVRNQAYSYLQLLEKGKLSSTQLDEISSFLTKTLCIDIPEHFADKLAELQEWLKSKLDRPIRVCGMVSNEKEPGGGPFIIKEADGSTSLQILESSQINMNDEAQKSFFEAGQFFNPVDIVCSTKRYDGTSYNLQSFINPKTAFVSSKSLEGRELKALERPGLWNGAMHHWLTVFVEVPIETFNPVKEVNDLLRPEHQGRLQTK